MSKSDQQIAGEGITASARDTDRHARTTTLYLRGHGQWVKIIRESVPRNWRFYRGYENVIQSQERQTWSIGSMPTWDDAIQHAARMIRDHK
ncbi:hypothetical protein PQR05_29865 [Paraburkholderia sediminicola]|uniref:hypothetical protein n=1 Tax=Paraburkholderia sediminicola TaxID=458836 RepID=UPI0038BCDC94